MITTGVLRQRVTADCSDATERWFTGALQTAASGTEADLLTLYTAMSRHVPGGPLAAAPPLVWAASGDPFPFQQWTRLDGARVCLLLTRADVVAPSQFFNEALACYEQGDAGEQRSWLRGVALLPSPERFLPTVIDACRTNIVPNFEAVACENPYPSRFFPEGNFNQLVMKALFNGVALSRILGLAARSNAELARIARDFEAERRAAGRAVPEDIRLAMSAGV